MKIQLNNKSEVLDTNQLSVTITELLTLKRYSFPHLVVRINGTLVKRDQYAFQSFKEGDTIEVIHLISGG